MHQAIYKCRLCGELFGLTTEAADKAKYITAGLTHSESNGIWPHLYKRNEAHNCQDGSFGFGDFQGFKKAEGVQ